MTLFLLWIGTYCISCVVQQTSGVKELSSLVRYDDSSLAAIGHVQSIIPVVRPRPNINSHSVLFDCKLQALPDLVGVPSLHRLYLQCNYSMLLLPLYMFVVAVLKTLLSLC